MSRTTLIAAAVVFGLSAPALAQNQQTREHMQVLVELRTLQEQQQRLQASVNLLVEALKTTNANLAAQTAETTKAIADLRAQLDAISTSLPQLRSLIDQTRVDVGRVGPEIDALRQALQIALKYLAQIVGMLEPVNPTGGLPTATDATQTTPPPTGGPPAMPASPTTYLNEANTYYARGDFRSAIDMFKEYLKLQPDSADAPFAQGQIGLSHFQLGEYNDALAAFRVVTEKYPTSDQAAEAYYHMGRAYESMPKQMDNAVKMYQLVTTKYKGTVAAIRAEERLKNIKK